MAISVIDFDDHFAERSGLHKCMCSIDICEGEALFVKQRFELAGVGQCCRLSKDRSVMRLTYTGEQRQKRKHTRVGRTTE
jgi:hypothetical protein